MRAVFLLLLLLPSLPTWGASADLHIRLTAPARIEPGILTTVSAVIENRGPDRAMAVRTELRFGTCLTQRTFAELAAGAGETLTCQDSFKNDTPAAVASGNVFSQTPDPDTDDNVVSRVVEINTPPLLEAEAYSPGRLDTAARFRVVVVVRNRAYTATSGVTATIRSDRARWDTVPSFCTVAGPEVTCTLGDLTSTRDLDGSRTGFELWAIAPDDPSGTPIVIETSARDRDGNSDDHSLTVDMYRSFFVTSTAAIGPGSLHDALLALPAGCAWDCKILFRIPLAGERWATIRPQSALPPARGVILDGRTQTEFAGDTNPDGPEIEINGELAGHGTIGLIVDSSRVHGLTVNGFGGPGLLLTGRAEVEGSFIGCDPTGTRAVSNERGIVLEKSEWGARITKNLISGNRRAGVFAWAGANPHIENNRILANGASGIFFGPGINGAYARDNEITANAHAGVAVAAGVHEVEIYDNTFHDNGFLAIDYLIDGVSRSVPGTAGPVDYPVITSARYDAATDTTIIEGFHRAEPGGSTTRVITLYANEEPDPSGFGEGQYLLISTNFAGFSAPADPPFTVRVKGRPRGRWISGTVTVTWHWYWLRNPRLHGNEQGFRTTTSEFGPAVPVEGY